MMMLAGSALSSCRPLQSGCVHSRLSLPLATIHLATQAQAVPTSSPTSCWHESFIERKSRRLRSFQAGLRQQTQRGSIRLLIGAIRCGGSESAAGTGETQRKGAPATAEETGLTLFMGGISGQLQKLPERSAKGMLPTRTATDAVATGTLALQTMGKEEAWGLVAHAVMGTGWVTGSGLEGPSAEAARSFRGQGRQPGSPLLSRSPRRRMAVEFTCNKCGSRTTRAINPLAYKEGTVFVQCQGCEVFHKLVDNLGLFHEIQGPIFGPAYRSPDIMYHQPYDPFASSNPEGLL